MFYCHCHGAFVGGGVATALDSDLRCLTCSATVLFGNLFRGNTSCTRFLFRRIAEVRRLVSRFPEHNDASNVSSMLGNRSHNFNAHV